MHFLKFYKILDDTARIVSFFDIFDKENVRYTTEDPARTLSL